jgi:hypothetical protein
VITKHAEQTLNFALRLIIGHDDCCGRRIQVVQKPAQRGGTRATRHDYVLKRDRLNIFVSVGGRFAVSPAKITLSECVHSPFIPARHDDSGSIFGDFSHDGFECSDLFFSRRQNLISPGQDD